MYLSLEETLYNVKKQYNTMKIFQHLNLNYNLPGFLTDEEELTVSRVFTVVVVVVEVDAMAANDSWIDLTSCSISCSCN